MVETEVKETALLWDQVGEKEYETGTDKGAVFLMDDKGAYMPGVAWNGLSKVTESPDGAEETPIYADNQKYLNLLSAENFKGTIEAFMYPDEFAQADGSAEVIPGVTVGQQTRKPFGFVYRTLKGNDVKETDFGYKIHVVYNAKVSPSERSNETVNDTPAAITFSWSFSTTPVAMPAPLKKSSTLTFDSTKLTPAVMKAVEDAVYGGGALPQPEALIKIAEEAAKKA